MDDPGRLPDAVEQVCAHWCRLADDLAPGLVTGLHLRGGLAFGEWRPGRSDVDFVAVLARRPSSSDLDALEQSHATLARSWPDLPFDGMHVLADDLAADPEDCPDVPCVLHGHFEREARYDLNPVAWHELAHGAVTMRGPSLGRGDVWADQDRLVEFTRHNLRTYWRDTAEALALMPSEGGSESACCWCVLGVARLDHLLVTGRTTTKSGAGRWALGHYPDRFHRVLTEALRIRDGGPSEYDEDAGARGLDTAAFVRHVVDGADGDA